jgi:hypothetical protein
MATNLQQLWQSGGAPMRMFVTLFNVKLLPVLMALAWFTSALAQSPHIPRASDFLLFDDRIIRVGGDQICPAALRAANHYTWLARRCTRRGAGRVEDGWRTASRCNTQRGDEFDAQNDGRSIFRRCHRCHGSHCAVVYGCD